MRGLDTQGEIQSMVVIILKQLNLDKRTEALHSTTLFMDATDHKGALTLHLKRLEGGASWLAMEDVLMMRRRWHFWMAHAVDVFVAADLLLEKAVAGRRGY